MTTKTRYLSATLLLAALLTTLPAAAQDFTGAWQNELGSYMVISSNNPLSGYYVNYAPNTNCRGVHYPISGSVYGNTIVFSVKWQGPLSCNSQTSWTGFLSPQGQIVTLWNLVVVGTTSPNQILKGSDTFTKVSQTSHESFLQE